MAGGYNGKNYRKNGSNETVIGGLLNIVTGGKVVANGVQAAYIADATGAAGANPTQAEYAALVAKFNAALLILKNAGIMAAS